MSADGRRHDAPARLPALLARLRGRLDLPAAQRSDAPARQQTLKATIEWSHGVLEPAERRLPAGLSVFAAGFTLEAVDAVCAEGEDALSRLAGLLDKSFVSRKGESDEPRFWLLETVRECALERLQERGEAERLHARPAEYFLMLAERAELELTGPQQGSWLDRLEAEHDNCRAASPGRARGTSRSTFGSPLPSAVSGTCGDTAAVRARLGEDLFAEAWARGADRELEAVAEPG